MSIAEQNLAPVAGRRILEWEGALNARDVGGLPTRDGQRIRPAALVRSDVPSRLTQAGREALLGHGVRTIIDVRSKAEVARDADSYPFRKAGDGSVVTYLHVPFTAGQDEETSEKVHARYQAAASREELNRIDLDEHAPGIVAIIRAVADAPPGGVLVHCHAGKDRTGLVIALMLLLAGVPDEEIADDYALTARNLEPLIVEWLDEVSEGDADRERLRTLAHPRREAMLDTLDYLRNRYGSVTAYLHAAGLGDADMERLRQRLVEGKP